MFHSKAQIEPTTKYSFFTGEVSFMRVLKLLQNVKRLNFMRDLYSFFQILGPLFYTWHPSAEFLDKGGMFQRFCRFIQQIGTQLVNLLGGSIKSALLPPIFLFIVEVSLNYHNVNEPQ